VPPRTETGVAADGRPSSRGTQGGPHLSRWLPVLTSPEEMLRRLHAAFATFPKITEERAWVGVRWQVGKATVARVFGGEDQRFRVTFRAELDEVLAFEHLGEPYFRAGWGSNVVGLLLDDNTDWDELAELLTDSYCLQAPAHLAAQVPRPG